jgi:hypothetical protein
MDVMKKFITALSLTLLIGTVSAQTSTQINDFKSANSTDKKGPIIIILCMPFPACEEN